MTISCLVKVLVSVSYNFTDMYMRDMENGTCASKGEPTIIKESSSTALVDGHNLLGNFQSMEKTQSICGTVSYREHFVEF